jgi:arylsulfatase A-like enzyme
MYLAFGNPHDPRVAAEKYMQQYRRDEIPLPKNYAPFHPFDNGELFVRDEQLAPWPRTETEVRKQLHEYYATITGMDHHLGRVLQALRDAGLAENTLIVYSSDHGLAMGSHGLFGKQSLYEHSMKSPLVFAGPGVAKGTSEAFVYLLDLFPTLVDLCGGTVPDGLDGRSFADAVRGKATAGRETICLSYRDSQRTIRLAHWKVHRYPQINRTMLFHLDRDPDETTDLSGDPTHRGRIEGMLGLLAKEQPRWGDRLPLNVPNPKPGTVTEETFRNRGKK